MNRWPPMMCTLTRRPTLRDGRAAVAISAGVVADQSVDRSADAAPAKDLAAHRNCGGTVIVAVRSTVGAL